MKNMSGMGMNMKMDKSMGDMKMDKSMGDMKMDKSMGDMKMDKSMGDRKWISLWVKRLGYQIHTGCHQ